MRKLLRVAWRLLRGLPLALLSPIFLFTAAIVLFLADLATAMTPKRKLRPETHPDTTNASIVIPNWNGRDLLAKYLPSVIASIENHPDSEIIVVDNGSTDGSAAFVAEAFPEVRVLPLTENLGFGGGSNAGFRAAHNDIVVLLNSDMRVERDFLQPLLDGFTDGKIFSVTCQIFFSDPTKVRQETDLTESWWQQGALRVRHRADEKIRDLYPCAYGGGGSSAFDRRKFLELRGFDEILAPFYLEDTDLGYMAWKRGWKTMYQPASVVYHEHRGTIGKTFSDAYIQGVLKKNFLLLRGKTSMNGDDCWSISSSPGLVPL
jgi:GT2 family glycosyltransferase